MFLSDLVDEFLFDCKVRALSELTVNNYRKQLKKFLLYLETAHGVTALEQMRPALIKQYISFLQGCSLKPAYINDLLKAVKCLCRYAFDEGYTEGLITERIKNVKQKKVLIHTFSNKEIAGMIKYYSGNNYLDVRNCYRRMNNYRIQIRPAFIVGCILTKTNRPAFGESINSP